MRFVCLPLPTLDAHAHIESSRAWTEFAESGAALACALSPDEATPGLDRQEPVVTWGVGCRTTEFVPGEIARIVADVAGQSTDADRS